MSKSSAQRVNRRRMLRELTLECAVCGSEIRPTDVESCGDVHLYMGRCSCGAVLQGAIGPPEVVADFQAYMTGYLAGQGHAPPIAVINDLPNGWHDGEFH